MQNNSKKLTKFEIATYSALFWPIENSKLRSNTKVIIESFYIDNKDLVQGTALDSGAEKNIFKWFNDEIFENEDISENEKVKIKQAIEVVKALQKIKEKYFYFVCGIVFRCYVDNLLYLIRYLKLKEKNDLSESIIDEISKKNELMKKIKQELMLKRPLLNSAFLFVITSSILAITFLEFPVMIKYLNLLPFLSDVNFKVSNLTITTFCVSLIISSLFFLVFIFLGRNKFNLLKHSSQKIQNEKVTDEAPEELK
ncbi:MAG: hypothetical protein LBJ93_03890 [Clostridiales bacterium]|jgi:hypothetical protein|nr:hypothetical protein [Clostridiales bacterium]